LSPNGTLKESGWFGRRVEKPRQLAVVLKNRLKNLFFQVDMVYGWEWNIGLR